MSLIFTADDFGAYNQIDDAIIQAVEAKKLNSVAIFPNGWALKTKIKKLEGAAKRAKVDLQIGCHFTTCSGSPLTRVHSDFVDGAYFKKFSKTRRAPRAEKHKELETLYIELMAQLSALQNLTTITHLSCHHNTLYWFEDYFKVLLAVAKESKLPIRSPYLVPMDQFETYQKTMGALNYRPFGKKRTRLLYKSWRENYHEKVPGIVKDFGVEHPEVSSTAHYGPIPFFRLNNDEIDGQVVDKHEALNAFIEKYGSSGEKAEIMFHLIRDGVKKKNKWRGLLKKGWYKGVNPKSVDGRMAEMRSLMKADLSNVTFGNWK